MGVREQAIGTWKMISLAVGEGAGKVEPYGPTPNGLMVVDPTGHFSITIVRPGLPKFASGNRERGTVDENRAVVQGGIAYFGRYTIDEADSSMTVTIKGTTFPNYLGDTQKRRLIFDGDEMIYVNASPSGGGGIAQARWKRVP